MLIEGTKGLDKYYYLVSSLPFLFFEAEKFPERNEFLEQCRMSMNSQDFKILESSTINGEISNTDPPQVLRDWFNWEASLRNELARLRSKKLDFNEEQFSQMNKVQQATYNEKQKKGLSIWVWILIVYLILQIALPLIGLFFRFVF